MVKLLIEVRLILPSQLHLGFLLLKKKKKKKFMFEFEFKLGVNALFIPIFWGHFCFGPYIYFTTFSP